MAMNPTFDGLSFLAILVILIPLMFLACVFFIGLCVSVFSRRNRIVGLCMMLLVGAVGFLLVGAGTMMYWARSQTTHELIQAQVTAARNESMAQEEFMRQTLEHKKTLLDEQHPSPHEAILQEMSEAKHAQPEVTEFPVESADHGDTGVQTDQTKADSNRKPTKPAWVDSPPLALDGKEAQVVESTACLMLHECEEDILRREADACRQYLARRGKAAKLDRTDLQDLALLARREHWTGQFDTSQGTANQIFSLLQFDDKFHNEANKRMERVIVANRVAATGLCSGGVMLALVSLFGVLKMKQKPAV